MSRLWGRMHSKTFDYLKPTESQLEVMEIAREKAAHYAWFLEGILRDGADKDHIMRQLRDVAMWVNVAITRLPDGTPRID